MYIRHFICECECELLSYRDGLFYISCLGVFAEYGGHLLQHIYKGFWHPKLHLFSSYHHMLGELVTSIASLIEGCTRQYYPTLMAKHVLGSLVGIWS
jgi:hypothetical protein